MMLARLYDTKRQSLVALEPDSIEVVVPIRGDSPYAPDPEADAVLIVTKSGNEIIAWCGEHDADAARSDAQILDLFDDLLLEALAEYSTAAVERFLGLP